MPNFFFKIFLSLCASPQLLTITIVSFESFLDSEIATEKAWLGSKDGLMLSYFDTVLKALRASSSLAAVYLALLVSFKKQWSGETPG